MTDRLRARRDFSRLSAEGTRARAGVLWCTYLLDSPEPPAGREAPSRPRVAFALSKAIGSAVVRNTVRRRLRALLNGPFNGSLPAGMYLFGATQAATARSYTELQFDLQQLLRRIPS